MISDQELIQKIHSLKQLKQIKPRENWVVFTRNSILGDSYVDHSATKLDHASGLSDIFDAIFSRKLAYSLAVLLLMFAGGYTLFNVYSLKKESQISNDRAAAAEAELKSNFKIMAEKSQNLAIAIEGEPQNLDQVVQDAKTAVEKATESIKKDPLLTKDVALEVMKNRAYLNIVGREDLKEANEEFYNTTFKAIYEGVTVPEDQKEELDSINESYTKGEIAPIMAVELALKVLSNSGK